MKRNAVLFAFLIVVLTPFVTRSHEAPLAAPGKDEWLKVQSKHFTLIGDASEKEIRGVGMRLEQFRDAFSQISTQLLSPSAIKSTVPITVIVFNNDTAFRPFKPVYQGKPADVAGYFQSSGDTAYITLAAGRVGEDPYATIFHEYVHALTSENARPFANPFPLWLNEGMAEYFSAFEILGGGTKAKLGAAIARHTRLLLEREPLPLKTLLAVDQASPFYLETEKKILFYAESWALMHYLLHGEAGKRRPQFRDFVQALAQGKSAEDSFKGAFQLDLATLERDLRRYILRGSYSVDESPLKQQVDFGAEMNTAPLSVAEAQAYLGDLLWRIQRSAEGEAFLNRALSIDPKLAMASLSLGTLRLRQHRYAEARTSLSRAIDAGSHNHLAHYYYAFAIHRALIDESQYVSEIPADSVKAMRAALGRARQLNPDFADTYKLLAFIDLVLGENLDEAIDLVDRAIALAPYREDIVYTRAQIQMRRKEYNAARQTAQTLVNGARKSDIRERAKTMLENIAVIEERMARAVAEGGSSEDVSRGAYVPHVTRPLGPGRRFQGDQIRGFLTQIDCDDASITLTIKSESRLFKLHTLHPGQLSFVRYTREVPASMICGPLSPAKPVIVTYRSSAQPNFDGEPIGVEFVKPDGLYSATAQ
jgi:tetratricopeptide (TPR) repeat protein